MLIEFSVGNFRSFYEPVTLSMLAANSKEKKEKESSLFSAGKRHLLKSAIIYGANASGKSNLVKAFAIMRRMVLHSTRGNSEDELPVEPFLLRHDSPIEPTYFQVVVQLGTVQYRYGFRATRHKIIEEWLYRTAKRESLLFGRDEESGIICGTGFPEGRGVEMRTRANSLFLTTVDQWSNGKNSAVALIQWFNTTGVISGLRNDPYFLYTATKLAEAGESGKSILSYLDSFRLGFDSLKVKKEKVGPPQFRQMKREDSADEEEWFTIDFKTEHTIYDDHGATEESIEFDLEEQESSGTKKIIALAGPILDTLKRGELLWIDELEAQLHPLLTRTLIEQFLSTTTNPHNAQLIFTTHDDTLLNLFRRDQIWFAEKNEREITRLRSLVQYKDVRLEANFSAEYRKGRYGAIPHIKSAETENDKETEIWAKNAK